MQQESNSSPPFTTGPVGCPRASGDSPYEPRIAELPNAHANLAGNRKNVNALYLASPWLHPNPRAIPPISHARLVAGVPLTVLGALEETIILVRITAARR